MALESWTLPTSENQAKLFSLIAWRQTGAKHTYLPFHVTEYSTLINKILSLGPLSCKKIILSYYYYYYYYYFSFKLHWDFRIGNPIDTWMGDARLSAFFFFLEWVYLYIILITNHFKNLTWKRWKYW